jgi:hypothetical protein
MLNPLQKRLRIDDEYIEFDTIYFVMDSILICEGIRFVFCLQLIRFFYRVNVPYQFNRIGFGLFKRFNKFLNSSLLTVLAFHFIHRVH